MEGPIATDTLCFTKTGVECIDDVQFIAVEDASDIGNDRFSGIIGLAPTNENADTKLPSFISQGESMFSFYLSKTEGEKGKITLGGYDLDSFAKAGKQNDEDVNWV